jgi:multicomponent Na+:H+ antiporter subunit D
MNPVLFIAIPLLAAFISVMFKRAAKIIMSVALLFNVVYSIVTAFLLNDPIFYEIGGFRPPFGINLLLDNYALIGLVLLNVVLGLIILLNFEKIEKYAVVVCVSIAALNGMILTSDLFNLFVFMEIAAITAYIFTTINKGFKHTFNYLILGTLASGLFLFGVIIIYNILGTLNILHVKSIIGASPYYYKNALVLPLILIFVGLSVEAKLLPFSGWVKGVLKNANGLVGSLIAAAYSTAILIVFGRLIASIFVFSDALMITVTVIAVATLVLAEFSAFSKRNIREILLFSSIAQSGLVVVLFLMGLYLPALLVLVNNVVSKLIMFSLAGKIAEKTGTDNIYELKGIFAKYKAVGVGFSIAAMSLIGLPMFFGFVAKANTLISLFQSDNIWLSILILLVGVVEGVYIMRILTNLWNTGEEGQLAKMSDVKEYDLGKIKMVGFIVVLLGIIILIIGILPLADIRGFLDNGIIKYLTNGLGGA